MAGVTALGEGLMYSVAGGTALGEGVMYRVWQEVLRKVRVLCTVCGRRYCAR